MQRDKIVKDLSDFIKIESVSTDQNRYHQILASVDFLNHKLKALGFEVKILKKDNIPPLIVATYNSTSPNARTIGVYAHYDVQPEDPIEEWDTEPFKLTVKNNKLYGRGAADDKGHIIQNLVAVEHLIKNNKLKNNIIFIFEGEEETGSQYFEKYINQVKDVLKKVDVFYVLDNGMYSKNIPQIYYGLRGVMTFELKLRIGSRDLHSGIYGNRVLNPIQVLADLAVKIKDSKTNKIKIPHFYDDLRKIDQNEMEVLKKVIRSNEEERENAGVYKIINLNNIPPSLISKIYPSFEINGIIGGYVSEGTKTVIPHTAILKFSLRLIEYQNPNKIEKLVRVFIKNNLPDGVEYHFTTFAKSVPFYTSIENEYIKHTALILEKVFGNKTLYNRSGGSIGAAEVLQRIFKKPIILTGFTLPDDNIHSPNENFDEQMFFKGIEALGKIYREL